jgi:acetyltransferase-like isoleucine patch superfamily enzyme
MEQECDCRVGLELLEKFREKNNPERLFSYPIPHPSVPSAFCPCGGSFLKAQWFYLKATILQIILQLPYNSLSVWVLRRMGAKIGEHVYISAGVVIDPLLVDLLTIEDNVLIGSGVKISFHEFQQDKFVAGRVTIHKFAVVGGFSMIGPGVEIGERANVAGGAVVMRPVPAGKIAIGNPARVI